MTLVTLKICHAGTGWRVEPYHTLAAALDAAVQMIDTSIFRVHHRDNRLARKLLSRLKPGSTLLVDRGYDADWIRELAMKKGG